MYSVFFTLIGSESVLVPICNTHEQNIDERFVQLPLLLCEKFLPRFGVNRPLKVSQEACCRACYALSVTYARWGFGGSARAECENNKWDRKKVK